MSWSKNDYPDSFKNLTIDTKSKAIEIGNALLDEGYEEERAIPIAIDRARSAMEGGQKEEEYHLLPHDNGWQLKKADGQRAIYVEETKNKLLDKAKKYANDHDGSLVIHKEDGSVETTLYDS
ncbi:DUF2188 domain-containing protein [Falsibacillus pallidus]|uniref:Uncharacterized protein DUF2188 n=1 Tax=Falsibacillus pallidus TaxID=493781 RepID=A0A370G2X9_9BACI|nr:DUF2188 domain-containing protein [Falsibacillus pallidus]RDI36944.1 uncharacterized protein DUF2188 [Falsibacillus pallidus]